MSIRTTNYKITVGENAAFRTKPLNGLLERIVFVPSEPVHVLIYAGDGSKELLLDKHVKEACSCIVRLPPCDAMGKQYGVLGDRVALDSSLDIVASGKLGSVLLVKFLVSQ